jgi:hypothetical protein
MTASRPFALRNALKKRSSVRRAAPNEAILEKIMVKEQMENTSRMPRITSDKMDP